MTYDEALVIVQATEKRIARHEAEIDRLRSLLLQASYTLTGSRRGGLLTALRKAARSWA